MIGAGVFTTSGFSLADLGSRDLVLLAWLIGGLIALCGAISYGGLVARITESGGEYVFLSRVVHPLAGFLAGWVSLLAGFTGAIAFAARAFETYALPESMRPDALPSGSLGVLVIAFFGLLHAFVARAGVAAQNAVVILKLVALAAFVGYAVTLLIGEGWIGTEQATKDAPFALLPFASSLVWISLSYSGFNASVYVTGEVKNARRNVPRSLWLGTLLVTFVYLALNAVFLYAPAPDAIASHRDVATIAARALGGRWLEELVRVAICLALLSSVSSMIVAGPRVYARMAEDGVFPRWFLPSDSNDTGGWPRAAILFQAALAAIVVCVATLGDLLSYLGFTLSLSAAGSVACLFVLRFRDPTSPRSFGYPVVPLCYITATLGLAALAAVERPWQLVAAAATLISGVLAYWIASRAEPSERRPLL